MYVVQPVKPPPAMPASHITGPAGAPAALFLVQLPANVPGKAVDDGSNSWALASHVGDQGGILSSWLQPGPAQVTVTI